MSERIALFGGTSEGRELAQLCAGRGLECHVFVATETGAAFLDALPVTVHTGRLDETGMEEALLRTAPRFVLDATHPYAVEVSQNLKKACEACGLPCIRILREEDCLRGDLEVSDAGQAAALLAERYAHDPVLLTCGSKELMRFREAAEMNPRIWARILPGEANCRLAQEAGIAPEHIVAGIGPFGEEENLALLARVKARALVTKQSGSRGGYEEKIRAARRHGAVSIVKKRPREEDGISMDEAAGMIERAGKKVTIIGCGMGGRGSLTLEALEALRSAQLVTGARRLVEDADLLEESRQARRIAAYQTDEIEALVREAPEEEIVLLVSGDSGFYSAAAAWLSMLERLFFQVRILPGISSLSALAAKSGVSWEDAAIFSLHARAHNYYAALAAEQKIALLGGDGFEQVLEELCGLGYADAQVWAGHRMGSAQEVILSGTASSLRGKVKEPLSVLLLKPAPKSGRRRCFGLADEDFVRGSIPMTKSEVRAVCMSRLAVGPRDTVYDVGAGTGSVSVEAAIAACRGRVFAVERNADALELILENAKRHLCRNLTVVHGEAPDALLDLPAPDAVMIGGSGGHLKKILETVLAKNPRARIVVTAVTPETLGEALRICECMGLESECSQIAVTRLLPRGMHHLQQAQNPVWVIRMEKRT